MNELTIFDRIKSILKEIFEIIGTWTGMLTNKAKFFGELMANFILGYNTAISNELIAHLNQSF